MLNQRLASLLVDASKQPVSCFGWVADYTKYLHSHGEDWITPKMLQATEESHAVFETALGKRDDNWAVWYGDNLASIKQFVDA